MKTVKNNFKRLVSVILCAALCLSGGVLNTQAKTKNFVKSITVIQKATITIPANKNSVTKSYKVHVKTSGSASKKFTATSGNSAVASVKVSGTNIKVTAKKSGVAVITVKTQDKNASGKKISKKLSVTVIKKSAGMTESEIRKKEGTITKKSLKWYEYDKDEIVSKSNPVYFSSAYPEVPFVSDSFMIRKYLQDMDYTSGWNPQKATKGLMHNYNLPMGTSIIFDYDDKVILFSDYTSTLVPNGDYMVFNPISPFGLKTTKLYKMSEKDLYYGGEPMVATYAYDEVPMLKHGTEILLPLQVMSDLFYSYYGFFLNYNGKGIYSVGADLMQAAQNNPGMKAFALQYNDCEKKDKISSALAQVNYYELCNALDARYGLQEEHNINTFDSYFARKGIKKRMLSTDLKTVEMATQDICTQLFEDNHSGANMQSIYLKEPVKSNSKISPVYVNRYKKMIEKEKIRQEKMGDHITGYERRGDTVFITFDGFYTMSAWDEYFDDGYTPAANMEDTIELFAYALRRLENEDREVKNVVVDLACNTGGTILSCAYAMQAICGQCNINIQNPNSWALHQSILDFDLNLDGKIDENDKSILDMGKNVAVNISDTSFSCGNLLPYALDQLDDRILLIGQKSGGGTCVVGYLSTAVTSAIQISSEQKFVTMKNGCIQDIDGGIAPDIYLTMNKLFDRDYIARLVREQF